MGRISSVVVVLGALVSLVFSSNGCSCDGGGGLGNCPDEVCNGVDDDCDGETDEDVAWETKGETCFVGLGACQAAGVFICDENDRLGPLVCSGAPGSGATEICNGVDDDCDGDTDEESQWGNRGDVCRVQLGGCEGVGIFICDPLSPDAPTICDAIAGPPVDEVCDGLDNDCDGETDEGVDWVDLGTICMAGIGTCEQPGLVICDVADPAGPTICNAQALPVGTEVCNGLDDDCDGETDEETIWADKGGPCTIGQGICETPGILLCDPADSAGPTICSATLRTSGTPEVCNGLDDDCDGQTDEDAAWVDKGSLCSRGLGACQRTGVLVCDPVDPAGQTICNAVAGAVGTEVCDRVDNDCDGTTDEEAPWADLGAICREGSGSCETVGVKVCDTSTPSGPTVCSVAAGTGGAEVCNGLDDDCDGSTDEDAAWTDKGTICTQGLGQCEATGTMVCDTVAPASATVCSATVGASATEICNGLDDNCDGSTDEDAAWSDKGTVCTVGQGQCAASGTFVCDTTTPGGPTVCSATPGATATEVCNGLDDDCDGLTDEDAAWADKGTVCVNGAGQCENSGTMICDTGNPAGPTVCSAIMGSSGTEVCNGLDDDCDGSTDEDAVWTDKGTSCTSGQGQCAANGVRVCDTADPAGATVCSATPGGAGAEVCNALDDDCDGQTDEGLWVDLGTICNTGIGACEQTGTLICDTGNPAGPSVCSVAGGPGGAEICNGFDDDCDGATDEITWADLGTICIVGSGACEAVGVRLCDTSNPAGPSVCSVTAGAPGTEVCNGLDDDCDGQADEIDWANKGTVCTVGSGQCETTGVRVCDTATPAGPTVCSVSAGAPGGEVCNGLDDDCDGSTDEDAVWANKGTVCTVGSGQCESSGTMVCNTATPAGPTLCSATAGAPGGEVCNGLDDDCDGSTDEIDWADKGTVCTAGSGQCEASGVRVCDTASPSSPTVCSATAGGAGVEICNGLDDDCDGNTDEDAQWADMGTVCTVGLGRCVATGTRGCDTGNPGGPTVCSATAGASGPEVCNGLDDDCDGSTDEDALWASKGSICTSGAGVCERTGTQICDSGNQAGPTICSASAGPSGAEICNGLDDDCDGGTDENAAWANLGTVCVEGTGTCETLGVRVCDTVSPAGPSVCSVSAGAAGAEVCNGLDDDCDGSTDEDAQWADKSTACTSGAGTCENAGTMICDTGTPAGPTVCSATTGAPGVEVCNGLDDDCDGLTDETSWSDKGDICTVSTGQCATSGVRVCDTVTPGGPTVCSATAGASGAEVCNGLDDDCDGLTDEDAQWADKGTVCVNGAGLCENSGTMICDTGTPGGPTICSAIMGAAGVEVCNGLDDDCDGSTDETSWTDKGDICTVSTGQCLATGVRVCDTVTPGAPTVCSATAGASGAEVCNGLDDDCDGGTDEDAPWADKGTVCSVGSGQCTATGTMGCDTGNPGGPTICSATAGAAGAEVCNGLDDDCDGGTDEDVAWADKGTGCTAGQGQCVTSGVKVCDTVTPAGPTVCSATAGAAGVEICNGLDDDCDGGTDEVVWADKGTICTAGTGACEQTGTRVCDTGNPGGATVCSVSGGVGSSEICNGFDDDCDGGTDEVTWVDLGTVCTVGAGACEAVGVKVCDSGNPGGPSICSVSPGASGAEVCNGLDDDCDGQVDELSWADKGTICTDGSGQCQAVGVKICDTVTPAGPTVCSASASAPGAEVCNGLDDDCDGSTDEISWVNKGTVCVVGSGQCAATGTRICDTGNPGGPTVCSATAGAPSAEVCNALDDDCDGSTDEVTWANKGTVCSVGSGQCEATGTMICDTGNPGGPAICSATTGAPSSEVCNGLDDDCDGSTDEVIWVDKGTVCTAGSGSCEQSGTRICDTGNPGGPTICSATSSAPSSEICNGLDDDCDGSTDEVIWADKGTICTSGSGTCEQTGTRICDTGNPGGPTVCSAAAGAPSSEICNGLDDDCDGGTDEVIWADKGTICTAGSGTCEAVGVKVCDTVTPAGPTVCSVSAGAPSSEVCNGLDDDCDGSTDEITWADKGTVCSVGSGQCAATGTLICNSGNPAGPTICSASAGAPGAEICNALDDDCDGSTDEVTWADKGTVCSVGSGQCTATGTLICNSGNPTGPTICSASAGAPAAEVCNALDDDCDGSTDEITWADKGDVCSVGSGQCVATGTLICDTGSPAGPTICSATAGAPSAEVCNGLDDDCDGGTDEITWADKGNICTAGNGACEQTGTRICDTGSPAGPTVCSVSAGAPGTEVCNGLDDDCDGGTDEVTWADLGTGCISGDGVCAQPGIKICDTGSPGGPTVCSAVPGAPSSEVCNGLDDDCDSSTDEVSWADKGDACNDGVGICLAAGIRVCDTGNPGGPTICSATAGAPGSESCNGLDDDCDNSIDDNLTAPVCLEQDGVCNGSLQNCGGGLGWQTCSGPEYGLNYEPTELTCDGLDNSCDGNTDTSLPAQPCADQDGVCAGSLATCGGGAWGACGAAEYGADYEASESSCDLLDNDCDGATDEGWLNGGKYDQDTACGNCFTDCTTIFAYPDSYGTCDSSGAPACQMTCCSIVDTHPACDGAFDYYDLDGVPGNGCEFQNDPDAIYVATPGNGGADSASCGASGSPCETLSTGLARASVTSAARVKVSGGAYYENIDLVGGIDVLGGYNPATWIQDPAANTTTIYGSTAAPGSPDDRWTIRAVSLAAKTTFEGFVVYGEIVTGTRGNSYAIYLEDVDDTLTLQNNVIFAGNGGLGIDGTGGGNGLVGLNGSIGVGAHDEAACPTDPGTNVSADSGGAGGTRACGATDVDGGSGGTNYCPDWDDNSSGWPAVPMVQSASANDGSNGLGALPGGGGLGGYDAFVYDDDGGRDSCSCLPPVDEEPDFGADGTNGGDGGGGGGGSGCSSPDGTVVAGRWEGLGGGPGTVGVAGSGGGGGGAGGGVDTWYDGNNPPSSSNDCPSSSGGNHDVGGSGGGGGSGGCGGDPGISGEGGGGAFGIYLYFTAPPAAAPVITGNTIYRGLGGAGGDGGNGGIGGVGGTGGAGGAEGPSGTDYWCAPRGGRGGEGGNGGPAGGGGGTCGGASFGIFSSGEGGVNFNAIRSGNSYVATGGGGSGGAGGISLSSNGVDGDDGTAADTNF